MKIQSILVPTDFSDDARAALDAAIDWATEFGATIHIVHAYFVDVPAVYGGYGGDFLLPADILEPVREAAETSVAELVDEAKQRGVSVEGRAMLGDASSSILAEAERLNVGPDRDGDPRPHGPQARDPRKHGRARRSQVALRRADGQGQRLIAWAPSIPRQSLSDRSPEEGQRARGSCRASPRPALRRVVSLPWLVLYGLGSTVGAGIYVLTGVVAGRAGRLAPLAFLLAAAVAMLTASSFAELSGRFPHAGGALVYVREGLRSRALSVTVGLLAASAGVISAATVSLGFVGYFSQLVALPFGVVLTAVVVGVGGLAAWGVRESVIAAGLVTLLEVAGLVAVLAFGAAHLVAEGGFAVGAIERNAAARADADVGGDSVRAACWPCSRARSSASTPISASRTW